jgi:Fe-S cluster assembly protein SufD
MTTTFPMTLPFSEALTRADSPAWWADTRRLALDSFLHADFPTTRQEEWKYTPLAHLERLNLHIPAPTAEHPRPPSYPGQVLAFLNDAQLGHGVYHGDYEYDEIVSSLQRVADSDIVRRHLGTLAGDSALVNLNNALWRDGAHVLIAADSRVKVPIFLAYLADEAEAMLYPRSLIVLEAGSEAVLVEHYRGHTDAPYWRNAVSEIVLEEGARLTHIRVLDEGASATHTGLTAVRLGRDSLYRVLHIGLGGALARHDLNVELAGDGAEVRIDALNLAGTGRESGVPIRDLHLRVEHRAADTLSRVHYRGLIDGHSRGVFDGRVVVHPDARRTDAHQLCRSLLLSPQAEADVKPQLEIHADDVKCGHGASVGYLDDAALFYLRSRGIASPDARRLLMQAFAGEALGLLDETGLKDWIMPSLLARLPGAKEELT